MPDDLSAFKRSLEFMEGNCVRIANMFGFTSVQSSGSSEHEYSIMPSTENAVGVMID